MVIVSFLCGTLCQNSPFISIKPLHFLAFIPKGLASPAGARFYVVE
jgi:hypothetical protein